MESADCFQCSGRYSWAVPSWIRAKQCFAMEIINISSDSYSYSCDLMWLWTKATLRSRSKQGYPSPGCSAIMLHSQIALASLLQNSQFEYAVTFLGFSCVWDMDLYLKNLTIIAVKANDLNLSFSEDSRDIEAWRLSWEQMWDVSISFSWAESAVSGCIPSTFSLALSREPLNISV